MSVGVGADVDVKVIHRSCLPVLCRKCSDSVLSQIENTASKRCACLTSC